MSFRQTVKQRPQLYLRTLEHAQALGVQTAPAAGAAKFCNRAMKPVRV
jgi:hypothetical protein